MAWQKGSVHIIEGRICVILGSRHPVQVRPDEAERLAYLLGEAAREVRAADLERRNKDDKQPETRHSCVCGNVCRGGSATCPHCKQDGEA